MAKVFSGFFFPIGRKNNLSRLIWGRRVEEHQTKKTQRENLCKHVQDDRNTST